MMNKRYQHTIYACFCGFVVQSIVNNFAPLLFVTFSGLYGVDLGRITLLVTINFAIQLAVDLCSVFFVDRIGYRASLVIAHAMSALGLAMLAVLPDLMPDSYAGLLICVIFYAIGGGLLEVVISPVMEACPTENKASAMSLLHSFYCWGHVAVVLLSTLFFTVFGIENWRIPALIWAVVPLINMIAFTRVPINKLPVSEEDNSEGESQSGFRSVIRLFKNPVFLLLPLLMTCAGASEQAVSQWASTFAEKGLSVSKTLGDLMGPMLFAILMGTARAIYGKYGERMDLNKCMIGSSLLCIMAYLLISLSPLPLLSLIGCGICGFSVGIFWPGSLSLAGRRFPAGGTGMYAILALFGDVGCSLGPTVAGLISGGAEHLSLGILCAVIFPVLMLAGLFLFGGKKKKGTAA